MSLAQSSDGFTSFSYQYQLPAPKLESSSGVLTSSGVLRLQSVLGDAMPPIHCPFEPSAAMTKSSRYFVYAPSVHTNSTSIYRSKSLSDLIPDSPKRVLPALAKIRCIPSRCVNEQHRCKTPKPRPDHTMWFRQLVYPKERKSSVYNGLSAMKSTVVSRIIFFCILCQNQCIWMFFPMKNCHYRNYIWYKKLYDKRYHTSYDWRVL